MLDDYDKRRAELEAANLPLLREFHGYLIDRKIGKRVSANHWDRIKFFADVYLTDYLDQPLAEGFDMIADYLGDWFIRKTMWSDVASMKANIDTFRKFYAWMKSTGRIDDKTFDELEKLITTSASTWIRRVQRYNDPAIDLDDVWEFDGEEAPEPGGAVAGEPSAMPHFILMLSGLAAKHFGVATGRLPKVDDLAAEGHWAACWRCDLLASDQDSGTYYFIFTNARTLYSLIVPDTERRLGGLVAFFAEILHHQFRLAGHDPGSGHSEIFSLVRGQPRSLIGSQNEMIRMAIHMFSDPDPSLDTLCMKLNRTPMSAIPEVFPDKAFLAHLAADPPGDQGNGSEVIPFPGPGRN